MVEEAEAAASSEPQVIESRIVNVSAAFLTDEAISMSGVKPYMMAPGLFPQKTEERVVEFTGETLEEMTKKAYPNDWGMRVRAVREGKLREPDGSIVSFRTVFLPVSTVYFDATLVSAEEMRESARNEGREQEIDAMLSVMKSSGIRGFVLTRNTELKPFRERDLIIATDRLGAPALA